MDASIFAHCNQLLLAFFSVICVEKFCHKEISILAPKLIELDRVHQLS